MSRLRFARKATISFVGGTDWVCFQKDGRIVVADPTEKQVLGEVEIPMGCLSFWVAKATDGQGVQGLFLVESELKTIQMEGGHHTSTPKWISVTLEEKPKGWAFDGTTRQLWLVGSKKIAKFDLGSQTLAYPKENKHGFSGCAVANNHLLLYSDRSYQLSFLDSHSTTTLADLSEPITCAAVAPHPDTGSCQIVFGTTSGNLICLNRGFSGDIKSKTTKKWHSSAVVCVAFSSDGRSVYSSAAEDVVMVWSPAEYKTDFIPRFTDQVEAMAISESATYFAAVLANGWVSVRHVQTFEVVFDYHGPSPGLFRQATNFQLGTCLGNINRHLRLNLYKLSPPQTESNSQFGLSGRQVNPTERNIVSSINSDPNCQYKIDAVGVSPDESMLVSAESLTIDGSLVVSRLRFLILKDQARKAESMGTVDGPHIDERILAIHFIVNRKTQGEITRKPHRHNRRKIGQNLGTVHLRFQQLCVLKRHGKKRQNRDCHSRKSKVLGCWTVAPKTIWPSPLMVRWYSWRSCWTHTD